MTRTSVSELHSIAARDAATASDACLADWLRLCLSGPLGISPLTLLLHFKTPRAIFEASYEDLTARCSPDAARRLSAPMCDAVCQRVQHALTWAGTPAHTLLTLADASYPARLLHLPDPPLVLYVDGDVTALSAPSLAIVGARNASPQGEENARQFARSLALQGLHIVSGLAQGIDAAAHLGALDASAQNASVGSTIAVMGTGVDRSYPARHRTLARRIRDAGALVSELPLGAPPAAHHFPRRNRLVAGLALGVLVVEAAGKSGSLLTARLAADQGREVFALPGSIHSPLSRGCHALIQQGAKLVETVADILTEILGQMNAPAQRTPGLPEDLPFAPTLSLAAGQLLDALGFDPVDTDTLLLRTGWPMADLASALMQVELDGHVVQTRDGRLQRVKR